jgi:hypothetical protein
LLGICGAFDVFSATPSPIVFVPGYFTPVPVLLISLSGIVDVTSFQSDTLNIDPWIFDGNATWTQLGHFALPVSPTSVTFNFPASLQVPAGHTLFWWLTTNTQTLSASIALIAQFSL